MSFIDMITAVAREIIYVFAVDFKFLPVYIILAFLIKSRYDRYKSFQDDLGGRPIKPGKRILEETILLGLIIGFLVSIIIVGIGIKLDGEAVIILFFIIIVLALINLRFVRFSYAAGILALISLIFKSVNINIMHLLILTAILSMVESALIFFTAGKDTIPVYIKSRDGIAGAFLTYKFWPVPVVFFVLFIQGDGAAANNYMTTGGYTELNPGTVAAGAMALGLDSFIGLLGYSDIAITKQPEEKSRQTAAGFFIYSCVLLLLAVLSQFGLLLKIFASFYAVLAYESVVLYGHFKEKRGEPIFKPARRGLRIFDIIQDSHADRMGLKRGDIILGLNGKDIQTEEGLMAALKDKSIFTWIDIIKTDGIKKTYQYRGLTGSNEEFGIVTVPREKEITYNVDHFENLVILRNLVARFRGKNKRI